MQSLASLPLLLDQGQLAELLGIARRMVMVWARAGRLPPPMVLGARATGRGQKVYRWPRDVIEQWLASRPLVGSEESVAHAKAARRRARDARRQLEELRREK